MTSKDISTSIFENYYNLLELYNNINTCIFFDLGFCKSIINKNKTWPNFIFNLKNNISTFEINTITKGINNNKFANIILANNSFAKNENILTSNGFKKVAVWSAMALNLLEYKQNLINYVLKIKIVESEQEINDWINIVKQELKIDFSINEIKNLINEKSINLFIGYYNNKAVCTTLTYENKNNIGHYMVATLKQFTKMGFGFEIMNYSINYCNNKNNNNKLAVLASTIQGTNLYNKLNYKKIDSFNVYWKLPNI